MHLIVVSGMLGAGKTSVILHLIKHLEGKVKLAVVENDFGSKGIDGDIIRSSGMEVQELKGGCICCTMKTGMIDALRFLESNHHPDMVIVEPTGIADPAYVLNSVDGISGLTIGRKTSIAVIDAERFLKMKRVFERPLKNQMNISDAVLMNKTDTQDDWTLDDIERDIRNMRYGGPILRINAELGTNIEGVMDVILRQ